jgi:hypothetical protein
MLVILHRWQPKTQRYQTQKFDIGQNEERVYLEMIFNKAAAAVDPLLKPMIMRTQRVDRISIEEGMNGPCIVVYLSPIIERQYVEVATPEGKKKLKASDVMCRCMHTVNHHAPNANATGKKLCLVAGCPCADLVIVGTHSEIINDDSIDAVGRMKQMGEEYKDGITPLSQDMQEIIGDLSGSITEKQDATITNTEERCLDCVKIDCDMNCPCMCHERNIQ